MSFTFDKAKPKRTKWLFLALFLALLAAYPLTRPLFQLAFDPTMPGGLAYTRQEQKNRLMFNSETWKAFPRSTNEWPHTALLPVRIRMVDDLLAHHDFKGQTREEVERRLGPRTKTEYFSGWDLVYYLGPGRYGNAIGDSEWLVFRFDSTDRVLDYKIVHD